MKQCSYDMLAGKLVGVPFVYLTEIRGAARCIFVYIFFWVSERAQGLGRVLISLGEWVGRTSLVAWVLWRRALVCHIEMKNYKLSLGTDLIIEAAKTHRARQTPSSRNASTVRSERAPPHKRIARGIGLLIANSSGTLVLQCFLFICTTQECLRTHASVLPHLV